MDPRAGREVRFKEPSGTENPIGPDGSVNLTVDGNGRVYEVEFMGTGFLADKGFVLTNRHVIQAWDEDDLASLIKMRGFRPRLKELLAYFPQIPQPFKLTPVETSSDQDVAFVRSIRATPSFLRCRSMRPAKESPAANPSCCSVIRRALKV
jgi:hypothetical protein